MLSESKLMTGGARDSKPIVTRQAKNVVFNLALIRNDQPMKNLTIKALKRWVHLKMREHK